MHETKLTNRLGRYLLAGLSLFLLGMAGSATAANYNIILKDQAGAPILCAGGGFSFTKSTDGSFSPSGASVTIRDGCITNIQGVTLNPGTLQVVVVTTTANGQSQGPNVEGLSSMLTGTQGLNTYKMTFSLSGSGASATRGYVLERFDSLGQLQQTVNGLYYVRNFANPIPEPETLALLLAGLGALGFFAKKRRRV